LRVLKCRHQSEEEDLFSPRAESFGILAVLLILIVFPVSLFRRQLTNKPKVRKSDEKE
jgi:hypothetical protein